MIAVEERTCRVCEESKPLDAFERGPSGAPRRVCRKCRAKRPRNPAVEQASYQRRRETILVQKRGYHAANRERENARSRAYYASHREEAIEAATERGRRRRQESPEKVRAARVRWYHANREAAIQQVLDRRLDSDEARAYAEILRADPCVYCGSAGGTVEHIRPRARGGSNEWDNLAGACAFCNSAKWAEELLYFLLGRAA